MSEVIDSGERRRFGAGLLFGAILFLAGAVVTYLGAPKAQTASARVFVRGNLASLTFNLASGMLLGFLIELYREVLTALQGYHEQLSRRAAQLDGQFKAVTDQLGKRLDRMTEYFALSTTEAGQDGSLERALTAMRAQPGAVRWVIAKFISKKISKSFSGPSNGDVEISNVHPQEFTTFLANVIVECSNELRFSCPFTPKGWFQAVLGDYYDEFVRTRTSISLDDPHLYLFKLFRESPVDTKRVVVWTRDQFDTLMAEATSQKDFEEAHFLLDEFVKVNQQVCDSQELSFIVTDKYEALDASGGKLPACAGTDFGIYDRAAVIAYRDNTLSLTLDAGSVREHECLFKEAMLARREADKRVVEGHYVAEGILELFSKTNAKWVAAAPDSP